jgi:hypothetical protein
VPPWITCFTTICEDWNREKIRVLEDCGYTVVVLWEREHKVVTGSVVREGIRAGGADWKSMVPNATLRAVERLNLRARLEDLSRASISRPAEARTGGKG